jgi:hypothetical protein
MQDLINVDISINGKVKIILSSNNDLGKEILKQLGAGTKVEITSEPGQLMGKPIPQGSIIISQEIN